MIETAEQYAFAWGWLTQDLRFRAAVLGQTLDAAAILAAISGAEAAAVADALR